MKFFFKVAQNPRQFYESLDYHSKRLFQNILFPEGFRFSMKNKECRTSKMNLIFELTSSFLKNYNPKKQKTQTQKVLESHIVDNSVEISNITSKDFELTIKSIYFIQSSLN